jgi:Spy/CpxP family protein refolding chaperone
MSIQFRIVAVALIVAATACAQPVTAPRGGIGAEHGPAVKCQCQAERPHDGMMGSNFFCPELVMRYQKEIGLTADQQTAIKSEMMNLAAHVTDLRWQQSAEKGVLADLLKEAKPDEKAILAEKEKVLKIEDDLKLSNLATLIRIKKALTLEQQEKMAELQKHMEHHPWRGHMMQHGMMRHGDMGFFGGPPPANPQ